MNSKFNKTFKTCFTESTLFLDLRYKKMSNKAIKLGSFLQCSVHIFLGHDGFLKNNFKNFQVNHGQCNIIIFLRTISLESSK